MLLACNVLLRHRTGCRISCWHINSAEMADFEVNRLQQKSVNGTEGQMANAGCIPAGNDIDRFRKMPDCAPVP